MQIGYLRCDDFILLLSTQFLPFCSRDLRQVGRNADNWCQDEKTTCEYEEE